MHDTREPASRAAQLSTIITIAVTAELQIVSKFVDSSLTRTHARIVLSYQCSTPLSNTLL
jgi:hypothetical protein